MGGSRLPLPRSPCQSASRRRYARYTCHGGMPVRLDDVRRVPLALVAGKRAGITDLDQSRLAARCHVTRHNSAIGDVLYGIYILICRLLPHAEG
jgi:hypothetical protein